MLIVQQLVKLEIIPKSFKLLNFIKSNLSKIPHSNDAYSLILFAFIQTENLNAAMDLIYLQLKQGLHLPSKQCMQYILKELFKRKRTCEALQLLHAAYNTPTYFKQVANFKPPLGIDWHKFKHVDTHKMDLDSESLAVILRGLSFVGFDQHCIYLLDLFEYSDEHLSAILKGLLMAKKLSGTSLVSSRLGKIEKSTLAHLFEFYCEKKKYDGAYKILDMFQDKFDLNILSKMIKYDIYHHKIIDLDGALQYIYENQIPIGKKLNIFNLLLNKIDNLDPCLSLYKLMKQDKMVDQITLVILLNKTTKQKRLQTAIDLIIEFEKMGIPMNKKCHTIMMNFYLDTGIIDSGLDHIGKMIGFNFKLGKKVVLYPHCRADNGAKKTMIYKLAKFPNRLHALNHAFIQTGTRIFYPEYEFMKRMLPGQRLPATYTQMKNE